MALPLGHLGHRGYNPDPAETFDTQARNFFYIVALPTIILLGIVGSTFIYSKYIKKDVNTNQNINKVEQKPIKNIETLIK